MWHFCLDPPVITQITPSETSITLIWTQFLNSTVYEFTIHYTFSVNGCAGISGFNDIVISDMVGLQFEYQFELTNLEENSEYDIYIVATNANGNTQGDTVRTETLIDSEFMVIAI